MIKTLKTMLRKCNFLLQEHANNIFFAQIKIFKIYVGGFKILNNFIL